MTSKTLSLAMLTGLLLTACIPSVNSFYTDKDVTFIPGLLGEWTTKDTSNDKEHWTFDRGKNISYALTITDEDGKHGSFIATLFKLKDHQFLDLIPADCAYATDQTDLVAVSMFPGHLLLHIAQIEPDLKLAFCDYDWLRRHLEANPKALAHLQDTNEERILLTAGTRNLQRFVLKHLREGELLSEYGELTKSSAEGKEPK